MYQQVEKPKENNSRAVANSIAQKKSNVKQAGRLVDNRPQAIVQRIIPERANNFPKANQSASTIQRAPVYIPGANGPYNGLADTGTVATGVRGFTGGQRGNIFNNTVPTGVLGVPGGVMANTYANQGAAGGNLLEPVNARKLEAQIDHIVPEGKGGGNTNKNAEIMDALSNGTKGNSYPSGHSVHEGGTRVYIEGGAPGILGTTILNASTIGGGEITIPANQTTPAAVGATLGIITLAAAINGPYVTQYPVDIAGATNIAALGGAVVAHTVVPTGTAIAAGENIAIHSEIPTGSAIPAGAVIPAGSTFSLACAQGFGMAPAYLVPH
jgi:hypothetical protein